MSDYNTGLALSMSSLTGELKAYIYFLCLLPTPFACVLVKSKKKSQQMLV